MSKDIEAVDTADTNTGESAPQFANLERALIVRSKTNPRTHFDPAYIQELAEDMKVRGVIQPLLLRPLPASRLQETFEDREPGAPLPTHEIVCGECRWRAAGLAGLASLPVMIRDLNDVEALQAQLVENLKRKQLHPLEEAEGFDRLMTEHHFAVADIAEKVKKSTSYVYKSLKLLELTAECKQELYAGKLEQSTALLVARAPAYLQAQIARDIMQQGFDNEPMSFRQAQRHIQDKYMLQLGSAVFDIADATLVPAAGDCKACPKRTGANSDLFEDVKSADTCTDPKCFDAKKEAHSERIAKAAAANGQKVIMGKEAKELLPYATSTPKGYKLLDDKDYIEGRFTSVRSAIGKDTLKKDGVKPVLILDPHSKQLKEALPVDVANKLLKKAASSAKGKKKPTDEDLMREVLKAIDAKLLTAVHQALTAGGMDEIGNDARNQLLRVMASRFAEELYETDEVLCELFGLGKVGSRSGIVEFLKECAAEDLHKAVVLVLLASELEGYEKNRTVQDLVVSELAIDFEALEAEAKAEVKERLAPEEKPAAAPAKGSKAAKPKKTSAADAQAGIAEAMQAADKSTVHVDAVETPNWPMPVAADKLAPGTRIRVKEGLTSTAKIRKLAGKEGTLEKLADGGAWFAKFPGNKDSYRLNTGEFEVLQPSATPAGIATKPIKASGKPAAKKPAAAAPLQPQAAWPFPPKEV